MHEVRVMQIKDQEKFRLSLEAEKKNTEKHFPERFKKELALQTP